MLAYAAREGATSFDVPGAQYTHRDGLCSFEVLIEENGLDDPALALMAKVIHGADVSEDSDATPQSPGLKAIADGFALLGIDDQHQLALELPVYDALYAWAQDQVAARSSGDGVGVPFADDERAEVQRPRTRGPPRSPNRTADRPLPTPSVGGRGGTDACRRCSA